MSNKTPTSAISTSSSEYVYWEDISFSSKLFLLIMSVLRIVFSILILFYTNIPPFLKVLAVILLDIIDCNPGRLLGIYTFPKFCKTTLYQKTDKISDFISYVLIFIYVFSNNFFSPEINLIILILFCYRIFGQYLFYKYNDKKYLIFFPNFAPELVFLLLLFLAFPSFFKDPWNKFAFIVSFVIWKVINELYLHYNSNLIQIKYKSESK